MLQIRRIEIGALRHVFPGDDAVIARRNIREGELAVLVA